MEVIKVEHVAYIVYHLTLRGRFGMIILILSLFLFLTLFHSFPPVSNSVGVFLRPRVSGGYECFVCVCVHYVGFTTNL